MAAKIILSSVAVFAAFCVPVFAQTEGQGSADPASSSAGMVPVVSRAEFEDLKSLVDANAQNAREMSLTLRDLAEGLRVLADVQRNYQTQLGQIAQTDESGTYWRFDANNQAARQEFQRALESTIPAEGTLVVRNLMNSDQYVVVNGQQQFVAAGATLTVTVPTGTVSTRLPGQQEVTWNIGFPNFEQRISIRPDQGSPVRQVVGYRGASDGVTTSTSYYAPTTTAYYTPTTSYYAPTTTYYTPSTSYYVPTTSYYVPTTSYYVPTTSYYAPTTSYYVPTTSYYAPTTAYYTPRTSYYVPTTSYYAPTTAYYYPSSSYYSSYYYPSSSYYSSYYYPYSSYYYSYYPTYRSRWWRW